MKKSKFKAGDVVKLVDTHHMSERTINRFKEQDELVVKSAEHPWVRFGNGIGGWSEDRFEMVKEFQAQMEVGKTYSYNYYDNQPHKQKIVVCVGHDNDRCVIRDKDYSTDKPEYRTVIGRVGKEGLTCWTEVKKPVIEGVIEKVVVRGNTVKVEFSLTDGVVDNVWLV